MRKFRSEIHRGHCHNIKMKRMTRSILSFVPIGCLSAISLILAKAVSHGMAQWYDIPIVIVLVVAAFMADTYSTKISVF